MSTDVSASASNEALLRKVIEAQMSGGYDRFQLILDGCHVRDDGLVVDPNENPIAHILAILLDAKGCKASFAHPTIEVTRLDSQGNETTYRRLVHGAWGTDRGPEIVAHRLIDTWFSEPANNVRALLQRAVSFISSQ